MVKGGSLHGDKTINPMAMHTIYISLSVSQNTFNFYIKFLYYIYQYILFGFASTSRYTKQSLNSFNILLYNVAFNAIFETFEIFFL